VTDQIAQVGKTSASKAGGWNSNSKLIKSSTRCQRPATAANLKAWALAQNQHPKGNYASTKI